MTRSRIQRFSFAIIFTLIAAFVIFYFSGAPIRKELPRPIAVVNYPKPVNDVLEKYFKTAFYFTTANNIGRLGMAYQANAENENAVTCYHLAIKKNSDQWLWQYYLGKLHLVQGDPLKAIEAFNAVMRLEPKNMLARYYLGEAHQKTGNIKASMKLFGEVIADSDEKEIVNPYRENYFPIKTYAQFQLARLFTQNNQPDSAALLLNQIINEQIRFGPAYRLLGSVYQQKDSSGLSAKFTVRANDLGDYSPPADPHLDEMTLLSRSDEYLLKQIDDAVRSDNFKWAHSLCEQAIKYLPENKQVISRFIREKIRQGNKEEAKKKLEQHLDYYKNDRKELLEFIDLLYDNGMPEEALLYFNQLKTLMPENAILPVWLYKRGKRTEAMKMMNNLLIQYPWDEKILAAVIPLIVEAEDIELAEQYLTRLQKKTPGSAASIKLSGLIAEKKGDVESALTLYETAFNVGENDPTFCKELTGTYMRLKKWQKANDYFKHSLLLHPNDPELLEAYGKFLLACPDTQFRNTAESLEYSERAFINVAGNYDTRLSAGKNLATAYVSQGNKKKAAFFINETIALAKKGNRQEEYLQYFRELTSAR